MVRTCVFCGSDDKLTLEHVFPDWLHTIGIATDPVVLVAGPLNRLGRELTPPTPYSTQVRDVCRSCNGGWMKRLEDLAAEVLTPWIRGEPATVQPPDQATIALWLQKTALVSLLVSAASGKMTGQGLPASEYHQLYEQRDAMVPMLASQVWIGHYTGPDRSPLLWVTPLVMRGTGIPESAWPQGYATTLVLGELLLHGVRLTMPMLDVPLDPPPDLLTIYPSLGLIVGPAQISVDGEVLQDLAAGKAVRALEADIRVEPWKPATELAQSELFGSKVKLPTLCGKHVLYYPEVLVRDAMFDRYVAFIASCECGTAYLVETTHDGAHCKAAGMPDGISELYEELPGEETTLSDRNGIFVFKRLSR
jgi:hypothetical protein